MKILHCFFLLFLLPLTVYSSVISVSGNCSGEWVADTVLVTGEVQVPSGQSLSVAPGTEVLFLGDFKLIVQNIAGFQAIGTETDSIRFDWYYPGTYWHGIRFLYAADSSRMEYCIIKHGYATGADTNGGGIAIVNCSPALTHCTIDSCKAANAGGGLSAYSTNSIFTFCAITNNVSDNDIGGMYFYGSSPILEENLISRNSAIDECGGVQFSQSNALVIGNIISENSANDFGGGMVISNTDCIIRTNLITENYSANSGGGVYVYSSGTMNVEIAENTISHNVSGNDGGGINLVLVSTALNVQISGNQIISNITETAGSHGGGIASYGASTTIENNIISYNQVSDLSFGGGIYLGGTIGSHLISANVISNNTAYSGGGLYCTVSGNTITGNQIYYNEALDEGGGIYCAGSDNEISTNYITNNQTLYPGTSARGGGLFLTGADNSVISNVINENSTYSGGGIYAADCPDLTMFNNDIAHNISVMFGGGIYFENIDIDCRDNNIRSNSAGLGGGIYALNSTINLTNHIIWENVFGQFYVSDITVNYSDVSGGYPGEGNFDRPPMFVAPLQPNGLLLWGSPCIDHGNPAYVDPDSTISDVGSHFYDQSKPVRIVTVPYDAPIQVSPEGGQFTFLLCLSNSALSPLPSTVWCDVTVPGSSAIIPVIGPVEVTPPAASNILRVRDQMVPFNAPAGIYHYNAYAVCADDTTSSSFVFVKLGQDSLGMYNSWLNTGESFDDIIANTDASNSIPQKTDLLSAYPNPFNPTTTISYYLEESSRITLIVYDIAGREIAKLVDGYRIAGLHEVTFDGTELASGLYVYCLTVDSDNLNGKMLLMK